MKTITKFELLQKIAKGVNGKTNWTKPVLLLTKDGDSYNDCVDSIKKKYNCFYFAGVEPDHIDFVRINNKLEMKVGDVVCNGHKPEVKVYINLGITYIEKDLRYCINLLEYENKPVIFIVCESDKNAGLENIPAWVNSEFEIMRVE